MRSKLDICANCTGFVPLHVNACPNCGKAKKSALARLGTLGGVFGSGAIAFTLMACYGAPCANDEVCRGDYDDGGGEDDSGRDANKPDVKVGDKDAASDAEIGDGGDGG
jgi:hypothetical protein